jgi:TolA-binding protein
MLRQPPHTDDVTPKSFAVTNGAAGWERAAWAMRHEPPQLDDVARARMERNLVEAWRGRGARSVALPVASAKPGFSRSAWIVSLAASAAFGAILAFVLLREPAEIASLPAEVPARFDLVIDDGSVQSGFLTEGQVLESGQHGRVEVALEQSRVDVAPDSRVRFERLGRKELRLALMKGRVEVAFHPERRGEQHMSIETRSARVLVVGTQFSVDVDGQGNTQVSVSEGVVQVVPRSEGETQFVRAGERIQVPIQAAREIERAVREGIESRLRAEPQEPEPDPVAPMGSIVNEGRGSRRQQCAQVSHDSSGSAISQSDRRLESARGLLLQGKHSAARERLRKLAKKNTLPTSSRVEALVLIAESYTSQGQIPRAAETYREAIKVAPNHPAGYNAMFALARLNERYADDRSAAGAVYREYLESAPRGALAAQAREALCRLGDSASCE